MRQLINKALAAAQRYTLWDFAWLKVTLLSLGIILGTYFAAFFLKHMTLLWLTFLVSYILILFRTFFVHWRKL